MNFLTSVRIGNRLAIGFAIVLGLSIISTFYGLVSTRSNAEATKSMMEIPLAKERIISDWYMLIYSAAARTSLIAKSTDDSLAVTFDEIIEAGAKKGAALQKSLEPLLVTEKEKSMYKATLALRAEYQSAKNQIMRAKKSGDAEEATHLYNDVFKSAASNYENRVLEFLNFQRKAIDDIASAIDKENRQSFNLMLALGLFLVAVGGVCAVVISRSITVPLQSAIVVATTVAAGDLSTSIESSSKDEIGDLLLALKAMNSSLHTTVSQVRSGVDTIATASGQIASGNMDLSSRTEHQASSLEETAASMEELTTTTKKNGDNARLANQLAVSASTVAVKGGTVVSQVVATMGSINESAKKIADIIGVIDAIAFQTNILALNAAVEAARAGTEGRGFAVVASEVRNLAQRSAAAAKEIKTLIGDSVEKVEAGSKLVNEAGITMGEIVASVGRVTDIMGEIAAASSEQEAGINQINQAITEMDNVTQQNAALVEQAAAAAQSLQDQAGNLAQVVSVFKLSGMQNIAAAPTAKLQRFPAHGMPQPLATNPRPVMITDSRRG